MDLSGQMIELLGKLIATPSFSKEEQAAADLIEQYLQAKDVKVERVANNLIVRTISYRPDRRDLLLNSHLDTVRPVDGWQRDPFGAEVENERLYGLGSNDAGGALVALIASLLTFADQQLPFNLVLVVSAEEEISGENGLRRLVPEMRPPVLAIVGEPTGMRLATSERGLMVLDCVAQGRAGHAARKTGINAIDIAIEDIRWFHSYRFPIVGEEEEVSMTATMISAGKQHNVVPAECKFVVDIRTADPWRNEKTLAVIQDTVTSTVIPRSTRLQPSALPKGHFAWEAAAMAGLQTFSSATLSDQALMPWPSVKIGPGKSERSHTAGEFITLSEIRDGVRGYINLIRQLARVYDKQQVKHENLG